MSLSRVCSTTNASLHSSLSSPPKKNNLLIFFFKWKLWCMQDLSGLSRWMCAALVSFRLTCFYGLGRIVLLLHCFFFFLLLKGFSCLRFEVTQTFVGVHLGRRFWPVSCPSPPFFCFFVFWCELLVDTMAAQSTKRYFAAKNLTYALAENCAQPAYHKYGGYFCYFNF